MTEPDRLKAILGGIVELAFMLNTGERTIPEKFRIRTGSPVARDHYASFYTTTQESDDPSRDLSVKSQIAVDMHLVKRNWWIRDVDGVPTLSVIEWHWEKDGMQSGGGEFNYRMIWSKPADEPGAKRAMAEQLAAVLKSIT
jgi:hypothetical protein